MKLLRDNDKVFITNEKDKKLFEMTFIQDEFAMIFYTGEPLLVERSLDENFYNSFASLLDNSYSFTDSFSISKENEIEWFSDMYCDLKNPEDTDTINRLIISKDEEGIYFETYNPYFNKRKLNKEYNLILFSSAGNGRYSKNKETGYTFQDDVVFTFRNILENKKDKVKTR